ncbi:hypothetical protein PQR66_33265, partial [Paraburkholderia agricolaris]
NQGKAQRPKDHPQTDHDNSKATPKTPPNSQNPTPSPISRPQGSTTLPSSTPPIGNLLNETETTCTEQHPTPEPQAKNPTRTPSAQREING